MFFCARIYLFWENNRIFFAQTLTKNAQVLEKNFKKSRKKKYAVFPILNALSKTLLKTFLPEPEYLSLQSKKSLNLRKKTKMSSAQEKWKIETSFSQISVIIWKFSARSIWLKEGFIWKKLPSCSFAHKKWKNEYFFRDVFLKVLKSSAQSRETKKHFLWEEIPN